MSGDYEAAFKGGQDMAAAAMQKVKQQLQDLEENPTKDSSRRQLQLSLLVLRSICSVAAKPEGKHYTVYCDTVVGVIAKYMNTSIDAKYWTVFIEHLRYLHHIFADKKLFNEAAQLCELMAGFYPNYLVSEGDYKIILGMYLQHLLYQQNHIRLNAIVAQEHSVNILNALKQLFIRMLHCNKEYNFTYPELITDFVHYLVPRRVSTVFNYLASMPANKTQMYDAFFALLKDIRTTLPTKDELQSHCQRHLEALTVFFQIDVPDRLQQQLALRHLRACREMSVFANDKSANYAFSLLYYLVKLVYGLPNPGEFKDIYKDLSGKFTKFFERYGDMLMQERWFTDVPIVIALLFSHIQHHPTTPFAFFWQHMTSIECYMAHFDLILGCIRLAPRIAETKLLKLDCCTSARKHTIVLFVVSSLSALSSYASTVDDSKKEIEEPFISFRTQILLVMRHGISVLDSLACIHSESPELKLIYGRLVQLTVDMRTTTQIQLCISLAEFLLRIRHKFTIQDWSLLLRRLYKMALRGENCDLTVDLHAAHIASMLQENEWPDVSLIRTRIGCFHTSSPHVRPGQCVLQLVLQSRSPFKVFLDAKQKYLLHWLEIQHFLKYHKSNEQLQLALMECSPSLYSELLVARGSGILQLRVSNRLRELKNELEQKMEKTAGLTRLEYLCWAHINTALLHDALKIQKEKLAVEAKCQEDNLEELLQRKELSSVTVANEVKLVKQANEALKGFQQFYEQADTKPIVSNDVFIDWEAIIEDLTSLALYLQLAGYTDLSTEAWILHYHIANTINDDFNSIRSLTYFCEYSEFFNSSSSNGIDLDTEIARKQSFLIDAMQQLPTLAKRFQNYVLLCVCQMACYHARNGCLGYAQILLELVQQLHRELPDQQGKYNVVLGTVDVIKFRILWKHLDSSQCRKKDTQLLRYSLLRDMEDILERFRGDFFKLSSSELMSYTILLLSLIGQIAECAANRLCDHFVNSYFAGILKLLLQSGSALRLVQMLSMWTWMNLQMEFVKKAQIKVKVIEYILGVKSLEALRQMSEEAAVEKKLTIPTTYTALEILHSGMEPIRKMIPSHASPIKTAKMQFSPSIRGENSLKRFLRTQCNDVLQQYEIFQWCYFMVGCLNARLHFLVDNHDNLEEFYESSQKWLQNHQQNTFLYISYQNIQLLSLQHYVNYLRVKKKYEKALSSIELALVNCTNMRGNVDTVYRINFLLQQNATKREMCENKENGKRSGLRRALAFNVSPDLDKPNEVSGMVISSTAIAAVSASARKKLTTPAFKIYGSNGRTPEHTPKSAVIATEVKKKKDNLLHLKSFSSVRKTRRNLVTETELQTPATTIIRNTKTKAKSLTARKLREMRAAVSDSSSNSTNSTPDIDILNQCQRIQSIDLLDSDECNEKENEVPNIDANANKISPRKSNKRSQGLLNICQKIESIDLVECDESTVILQNISTSMPKTQVYKDNTLEIVEILDDSPKTPDSTFGKLTIPAKTSNAKSTAKKAPPSTRTAQARYKSKEQKSTNKSSTDAKPTETTTILPSEPHIEVVEKIQITEDTRATTTKSKTHTKTEIRKVKVITKETEIKIISPRMQTTTSTTTTTKEQDNNNTESSSTTKTRGRPRATRKGANSSNEDSIEPPVTVSRTLGRRARQ